RAAGADRPSKSVMIAQSQATHVRPADGRERDKHHKEKQERDPMLLRSAILSAISAAALVAGLATAAPAQTYPERTVKFILPFGPGSGADITMRIVGEKLAARWGKPVVIENRPGGDGLVAINAFLAANDQHNLLYVPVGTFAVH